MHLRVAVLACVILSKTILFGAEVRSGVGLAEGRCAVNWPNQIGIGGVIGNWPSVALLFLFFPILFISVLEFELVDRFVLLHGFSGEVGVFMG